MLTLTPTNSVYPSRHDWYRTLRRGAKIPPIHGPGPEGVTSDTTEMAQIFKQRFFDITPTTAAQGERPPVTFPTRPFHQVTQDEVARALTPTSNKPAPGPGPPEGPE